MKAISTSKKSGRPAQYVVFEGRTIVGLSGPKPPIDVEEGSDRYPDGRYYSTHNDPKTGRREYFGRDLEEAVKLFRAWETRRVPLLDKG